MSLLPSSRASPAPHLSLEQSRAAMTRCPRSSRLLAPEPVWIEKDPLHDDHDASRLCASRWSRSYDGAPVTAQTLPCSSRSLHSSSCSAARAMQERRTPCLHAKPLCVSRWRSNFCERLRCSVFLFCAAGRSQNRWTYGDQIQKVNGGSNQQAGSSARMTANRNLLAPSPSLRRPLAAETRVLWRVRLPQFHCRSKSPPSKPARAAAL